MKKLLSSIIDLIYPLASECSLCGDQYDGEVCHKCLRELALVSDSSCVICGRFLSAAYGEGQSTCPFCNGERPPFSIARSVGPYEGQLKQAIYFFKYTGKQSLAPLLSRLLVEKIVRDEGYLPVDLIIPVPVHKDKMLERTFNQAELLARGVGKSLGLPTDCQCLTRIRNTPNLSKLSVRERREILKGAFAVRHRERILGKNVLLIDDIFTTGYTVGECTGVLQEAGASEVFVCTLAAGKIPSNKSKKEI